MANQQPAPRPLVIALTTGSTLIVVFELLAHLARAERWPLHAGAAAVLLIMLFVVVGARGRPEKPEGNQQ